MRTRHKIGLLLLASTAMIAPAAAQNAGQQAAKTLLQAADKAIGASNVKSLTTDRHRLEGLPGSAVRRRRPAALRHEDHPHHRLRRQVLEFGLQPHPGDQRHSRRGRRFPVQGEQHFAELGSGDYAWNLNPQGQPVRQAATDAGDRQLSIATNPIGFIKAAEAADNAAVTDRYFGRQNRTVKVVAFTTKVCDGPQPQCTRRLTGEFNNDNMLERVITWIPDPVMGDKMVEYRWSDYRDVGGGVNYPFHLHAHMGDHPLIPGGHNWLDLRTTDVKVNVADAAHGPRRVRNAPSPTQARVVATTLAPGVVLMGGGSHNSIAVEFKDYVTVIEGPLSNQRTNAVVAEVRKTFPNKPIRYLVNTHNHFDHLGGVRGYVAEGATVITDDKNKNFYQRVVLAPQPRSLQTDRLSTVTVRSNRTGYAGVTDVHGPLYDQRWQRDDRTLPCRWS